METDRRTFLRATVASGLAMAASTQSRARAEGTMRQDERKEKESEFEISAPEDLMREHGVLNRILLVYEEGLRRLRSREDAPPEVFHTAASLVRRFVEDYHEHLEEQFIFPRFGPDHDLASLVAVLREQHQAGRRLTDRILRSAVAGRFGTTDGRQDVIDACEAFIRMYRPHEAREDTVLFPALYTVAPPKAVAELGERFEEEEHRRFGEDGFDTVVAQVATVEKELGIYELARFTPR